VVELRSSRIVAKFFCTEIAVEKDFNPLKCDFWGPQKIKMFSASGGLRPPDPLTRGSAPGPRWGLCPQTPVIGSRSRARHARGSSPPKRDTLASPLVGCYIWYSEEGTGRGPSPPMPLLAVPNVHPSINGQCTSHCCYGYRFRVLGMQRKQEIRSVELGVCPMQLFHF